MITRNILMFGGRAVGKSSVLAAIYDQASELMASSSLTWVADDVAFNALKKKKSVLLEASKNTIDEPFKMQRYGDITTSKYSFEVGKKMGKPELELVFVDTAGEKFNEGDPEFNELFKDSRAAILVVNAIELMEGEELPEHEKKNDPDLVFEHIKKWLRHDPEHPRLLVIALAKTEKWLRKRPGFNSDSSMYALHSKLKDQFSNVFNYLQDDEIQEKVALVICPVQTCGNIIFDEYREENGSFIEYLRSIKANNNGEQNGTGYAPIDCDQPLRYILNFFINMQVATDQMEAEENSPWWLNWIPGMKKLYAGIYVVFSDYQLIEAVEVFGQGIKSDMPFKIVQGEHLIR